MDDDLAQRVAAIDFWYHHVELPGGIITPGAHPLDATAYRLPDDLSGKRVLDVGAFDGFWTFEAIKRGAQEVVAIDDFSDLPYFGVTTDRKPWETFDLCRAALRIDPRRCWRQQLSVYKLADSTYGPFDVVFFFGVLYHCRYPMLALDNVAAVCRPGGEIYVESAVADHYSPYRGGCGCGYAGGHCIAEFYPTAEYGKNATNWWAPTLRCLKAMLAAAGFCDITAWQPAQTPAAVRFCRAWAHATKV